MEYKAAFSVTDLMYSTGLSIFLDNEFTVLLELEVSDGSAFESVRKILSPIVLLINSATVCHTSVTLNARVTPPA